MSELELPPKYVWKWGPLGALEVISVAAPPASDLAYLNASVITPSLPPSEHVGVERDAS